jgi:hypothetical protein
MRPEHEGKSGFDALKLHVAGQSNLLEYRLSAQKSPKDKSKIALLTCKRLWHIKTMKTRYYMPFLLISGKRTPYPLGQTWLSPAAAIKV